MTLTFKNIAKATVTFAALSMATMPSNVLAGAGGAGSVDATDASGNTSQEAADTGASNTNTGAGQHGSAPGASATGVCSNAPCGPTNTTSNGGGDSTPLSCSITATKRNGNVMTGRVQYGQSFSASVRFVIRLPGSLAVGQTFHAQGAPTSNLLTCLAETAKKVEQQTFTYCADPSSVTATQSTVFGGDKNHTVDLPARPTCGSSTTTPTKSTGTPVRATMTPVYVPNTVVTTKAGSCAGIPTIISDLKRQTPSDVRVDPTPHVGADYSQFTDAEVAAQNSCTDYGIVRKDDAVCAFKMETGVTSAAIDFAKGGECKTQKMEVVAIIPTPAPAPVAVAPQTTEPSCTALKATSNVTFTFNETTDGLMAGAVASFKAGDTIAANCDGKIAYNLGNGSFTDVKPTMTKGQNQGSCSAVTAVCTASGFVPK